MAEVEGRVPAKACEAKVLNCWVSADHHCSGSTAGAAVLFVGFDGLGWVAAAGPDGAEKACAHCETGTFIDSSVAKVIRCTSKAWMEA